MKKLLVLLILVAIGVAVAKKVRDRLIRPRFESSSGPASAGPVSRRARIARS